jgi:hypothetical protein
VVGEREEGCFMQCCQVADITALSVSINVVVYERKVVGDVATLL